MQERSGVYTDVPKEAVWVVGNLTGGLEDEGLRVRLHGGVTRSLTGRTGDGGGAGRWRTEDWCGGLLGRVEGLWLACLGMGFWRRSGGGAWDMEERVFEVLGFGVCCTGRPKVFDIRPRCTFR